MAIYDLPKAEKSELKTSPVPKVQYTEEESSAASEMSEAIQSAAIKKGQLFSAIAARVFFFLLFVADILWAVYALLILTYSLIGLLCSGGKVPHFKTFSEKYWIALRRSLVCGVSLLIALFSPAFGIMVACTYFLMYDKSGIEEVVPESLQSQFKEFTLNS
jgi:hypothetical protein